VIFRSRRKPAAGNGQATVKEPPASVPDVEEYRMEPTALTPLPPAELDALFAEIDALTRSNRGPRDPEVEARLLELRHRAGAGLIADPPHRPEQPSPAEGLPAHGPNGSALPEVSADELTPGLLRAGMLQNGCLLVRGLVDPETSADLAHGIDAAFAERSGSPTDPSHRYYREFAPDPPFPVLGERPWIEEGGGVLAVDSPRVMFDVLEAFEQADMPELIRDYLGERPALSANKSTLRKAEPSVPGAWHQDGSFLGDVRALNVWLALSRCGDTAPGLDVVPRRLDDYVPTGTEGTYLGFQVSQAIAEQAAGEAGIERPIFNPGDALLFDELFLHQTASDPSMPNVRYAVEAWFFGPSAFPNGYVPISY
jgi:hypothetical protein